MRHVNGADWKVRSGDYGALKFPYVLGRDFSGTVSALGEGVTDFKVGDAVFAVLPPGQEGTYAEKIAVKAAVVAKKPENLSHENAAALALTGLTALDSVENTLKLKRGETILIQGGAGGVAGFAIQLAKHIGARVISTTSTANVDYVRSLGADQVIDYGKEDFTRIGQVCDAVFETVGGEVAQKSSRCSSPAAAPPSSPPAARRRLRSAPTCRACGRRCRARVPRWSASPNCSGPVPCARRRSSSTSSRKPPTRIASARAGISAASWCSKSGDQARCAAAKDFATTSSAGVRKGSRE